MPLAWVSRQDYGSVLRENIMKINDLTQPQTQRSGAGRGTEEASASTSGKGKAVTPTSAADTVNLSDTAQKLNELQERLSAVPVVDGQRVEAIRTAVENGSYQIDPMRVAEKLMKYEEQL
jgi:negative regulator of flagellin synthesis FlgM